jgi:MOSC domain-containing protein YiiM
MRHAVDAVLAGRAAPFRGEEPSAIAKLPVSGPVAVGALGLAGDEQADRRVHGGPDKALHHYPRDHYAAWRAELGDLAPIDQAGAFGENISTTGLTEGDLRIGDRFRLGTALVEVSHGRQPCWKLDHRFGGAAILKRVVQTGRCGWYYRVLEPGTVAAGDDLALVERGAADWTVARVFHLLIGGGHRAEPETLSHLAALPALADAWRAKAAALAGQ